jgi:hypothetical protein
MSLLDTEGDLRWALVRSARDRDEIAQYLPANYHVVHQDLNGQGVLIVGVDNAGWTLDDYVIPRLASGLIAATEVWPLFTSETSTGTVNMDVPREWLYGNIPTALYESIEKAG